MYIALQTSVDSKSSNEILYQYTDNDPFTGTSNSCGNPEPISAISSTLRPLLHKALLKFHSLWTFFTWHSTLQQTQEPSNGQN